MRESRGKADTVEAQAAFYVQAAAEASARLQSNNSGSAARQAYNDAVARLTVLLRGADDGQHWNRPMSISAGGKTYRLKYAPGNRSGVWAPDYFTSFAIAQDVEAKSVKRRDVQKGVGGALVGVRKESPPEPFAPLVGVTAPVTSILSFQGRDATLTLWDPSEQRTARIAGSTLPLAADYSAPLAYYPTANETITGLMAALRGGEYLQTTGLYMLQPYDPDRIPLIFVHGLISTARMWRNVINEIEMDPDLRGRFQCWVFNYPTGNPVAYSALRFREELAKEEKLHGFPHGLVLVGHSMGGIVSRMQATTFNRSEWDRDLGGPLERLVMNQPKESLVHRALIFDANPKIRRIVFICTPHRGSDLATGGLGTFAMRLISLPGRLTSAVGQSMASTLSAFSGHTGQLPNSVTSLSPSNPTLKVMDKLPIRAPYHSIIGDRGRGDSPNSSDGVVAYWSSHQDGAKSEKIVPGPHGSCELPETIAEVKRILHLHLQASSN